MAKPSPPKSDDDQEAVWDGRGKGLSAARLTILPAAVADDLRLGELHFRILSFIARQNAQRGWLRLSQVELASRWNFSRNAINRALSELKSWDYLLVRSQQETRESFCYYKVVLEPAVRVHTLVCTPQGGAQTEVHSRTPTRGTRAKSECAPLIYRDTDKPTLADKRGGNRVDELLEDFATSSADEITIEHFLRPVLDVREIRAPNPESAVRDVLLRGIGLSTGQLKAAAANVLRTRTHNVGHSDLTKALDAVRIAKGSPQLVIGELEIRPETNPDEWEAWHAYASENRKSDALAYRVYSTMPHGFALVPSLMPPTGSRRVA